MLSKPYRNLFVFISTVIALENGMLEASVFGIAESVTPLDLSNANRNYMALMLGSKGINDRRGTDMQLRQMIDGAMTTGITDRLYNFGDRQYIFKVQAAALTGRKRLHVQLAYAFYALGYYEPSDIGQLKGRVLQLCGNLEPDFDREFTNLCGLVYTGTIFAYKNSLEDVIKRTTSPLSRADFVRQQTAGVIAIPAPPPPPPPPPAIQGDDAPKVERYYTDAELASLDPAVIAPYKRLREQGRPPKLARMQGQLPAKYEGDVAAAIPAPPPPPPPPPPAIQGDDAPKVERYYTDAELASLDPAVIAPYKRLREQGRPPKLARMQGQLPAKYENTAAGSPASVPIGIPATAPGGLLAGIASADPLARLKKIQKPAAISEPAAASAASPKTPPAVQNPMMLQLQRLLAQKKRNDSVSSGDGDDW